MLPEIKNDLLHLLNILESCEKVLLYTKEYNNAEELYNSKEQINYNASLTLLSNIGEAILKISNKLKEIYKEIEWQKIKNFRNRVVHDYEGLDIFIVYKIVKEQIPKLKKEIKKIIRNGLKLEYFDIQEYKISKESKYYKHIDFDEIN